MSNDLKVWLEPKDPTVEGHSVQCTLTFNDEVVWGPHSCSPNTAHLRRALHGADPRFDLQLSEISKEVAGHTQTISVKFGHTLYLDKLSTHEDMSGLCEAIEKCLKGSE